MCQVGEQNDLSHSPTPTRRRRELGEEMAYIHAIIVRLPRISKAREPRNDMRG